MSRLNFKKIADVKVGTYGSPVLARIGRGCVVHVKRKPGQDMIVVKRDGSKVWVRPDDGTPIRSRRSYRDTQDHLDAGVLAREIDDITEIAVS